MYKILNATTAKTILLNKHIGNFIFFLYEIWNCNFFVFVSTKSKNIAPFIGGPTFFKNIANFIGTS
jgi:hypothetical protein